MSYPQCNHIMSDGLKCKSPALKRQSYCYFHHRYNQRQRRRVQLGGPVGTNQNTGIELPIIESWETIQIGIQEILESIIDSRIDPKRAGLMLYALQLASQNLKMMKYPGISQPNGVTELPEEDVREGHGFSRAESEPKEEPVPAPHLPQSANVGTNATDTSSDGAPCLPQSANVGTTNLNDLSSRGGRESDEGSAVSPTTTDLLLPAMPSDSVLKGHGFSRADDDANENGALAPEVIKPDDPIPVDLRLRYPSQPDANLMRLIPQPNDDATRAYYKPYDSVKRREQIRQRRYVLGFEPLESRI